MFHLQISMNDSQYDFPWNTDILAPVIYGDKTIICTFADVFVLFENRSYSCDCFPSLSEEVQRKRIIERVTPSEISYELELLKWDTSILSFGQVKSEP